MSGLVLSFCVGRITEQGASTVAVEGGDGEWVIRRSNTLAVLDVAGVTMPPRQDGFVSPVATYTSWDDTVTRTKSDRRPVLDTCLLQESFCLDSHPLETPLAQCVTPGSGGSSIELFAYPRAYENP